MPLARANVLWEHSLALDPRNAELRGLFGAWGLIVGGRGADDVRGEAEIRRATQDDPRSAIVCTIGAIGFSVLGLHDDAIACARRGREADPAAFAPSYAQVWTLCWAGRIDEAFAAAEQALEQFGRHPFLLQVLTSLYLTRGDRRRAEAIHAELTARAITSRVPFFSLAFSALALGLVGEAMEHAIASAKVHDGLGPVWLRWPGLEPLTQHPRYADLLEMYHTRESAWRDAITA
jgi:tetratricopeptide (TPR) repeat protein